MHWTLASLPELGHLSRREARIVIRRCIPLSARIGLWLRPVLVSLCIGLIIMMVTVEFGAKHLAGPVLAVSCSAGWIVVHLRQVQANLRDELRTLLAGSRAPACLVCGFDLRASASASCPECGAATAFPEAP